MGLLECVVSLRENLKKLPSVGSPAEFSSLTRDIAVSSSRAKIYSSNSGAALRRFNEFLDDSSDYTSAAAAYLLENGSLPENFESGATILLECASECERQLLTTADLLFAENEDGNGKSPAMASLSRLERLFDNYFPPETPDYTENGGEFWLTLENQPEFSVVRAKDAGKELFGANLTLKVTQGSKNPDVWLVTCDSAYAEITKAGGFPVKIASSRKISEPRLTEKEALAALDSFVIKYYPAVSREAYTSDYRTLRAEYYPKNGGETDESCGIECEIALDCGRLTYFDASDFLKNYK